MPQHFGLDRLAVLSYLCLLAGCVQPAPAPETLPTIGRRQAAEWAAETTPADHRLIRFRWLFNNGEASIGGQGSARIAGPDSLRFDIAGPWGMGGAAAMVLGDGAEWVQPPDIIARLIPSYPLMWAMFGVMRPPPIGAELRGVRRGARTALEWSLGADTVRYRMGNPGRAVFEADWQRSGVTMGMVETRLDARGAPVSARLTVPSVPARLDLSIVADSNVPAFPPMVWLPPAP